MISVPSDLYISEALTNVSVATDPNQDDYIAARLFPVVTVKQQAAKYWEYPRGEWFRSAAQIRGPGQESAGTSWQVISKDAYYCNLYSLHTDIDDFSRANAASNFNLDNDATKFLMNHIKMKREFDFLSKVYQPGVWATDITPTTKWDQPNATIYKDIRTQMTATKIKTGKRPNKIVFQERVWDYIQDSPDMLSRVTGGAVVGNPARATQEDIAKVLGLQEVIVAGAIQNNGIEGQADAFSFAPGQHALLLYSPPSPGLMQLAAGYTFVWTDLYGIGPEGERVAKFRMEHLRSDRIEAEGNWDHRIIGSDLGVLFANVLSV